MRFPALPSRPASLSGPPESAARPWRVRACAAGLACLLAAMAPGAGASAPAGSGADGSVAALRSQIQALVGEAPCSSDADCRSSPIGAKACGGPEAYIAWSARTTDEAALGTALAGYTAAQRTAITREGRVSNCEFVTDPGAVCVASGQAGGRCQLRKQPRGHGGQSTR
jgi:hypothetical protein